MQIVIKFDTPELSGESPKGIYVEQMGKVYMRQPLAILLKFEAKSLRERLYCIPQTISPVAVKLK
jgi:hypothetical protein